MRIIQYEILRMILFLGEKKCWKKKNCNICQYYLFYLSVDSCISGNAEHVVDAAWEENKRHGSRAVEALINIKEMDIHGFDTEVHEFHEGWKRWRRIRVCDEIWL